MSIKNHIINLIVAGLASYSQTVNAICSVGNGFSTGVGSQPSTIWFAPNGKFAYILLGGLNKITTYKYDKQQGKLSHIPEFDIGSGGVNPTFGGAIDYTGRFMYVTNKDSSTIVVFAINQENGKLTKIQSIASPYYFPYVISLSPDGQYAFVTVFHANKLLVYKINQLTGILTPYTTKLYHNGYLNVKNQPFSLTFAPGNKYAYLASYGENSIVRYNYNQASGELTMDDSWQLSTRSLSKPFALLFHPNGKYAYVPADHRNKILQFTNDNDEIKENVIAEVDTGNNPNTFMPFYFSGKFTYMANFNDSTIDIYEVQDNGTLLARVPRHKTIINPIVIRQPPDASHIFVLSRTENCIADYNIESNTGNLTPRHVNDHANN